MASQVFDSYFRGMLARAHPRRTPPGYQRELLNLLPLGGVPRSRPGLRPYHANPSVSSGGTGLIGLGWHVSTAGTRELLAVDGDLTSGILRIKPFQAQEVLSMPAGLTRTTAARAFTLNLSGGANLTFIYDGVNDNLKYDGTSLSRMGLSAAATPTAPSNDLGASVAALTNGTRKYVYTYESAFHEGNPTPMTAARVVTLADPTNSTRQRSTFTLPTAATIGDAQVTTVKLYRTIKDGEDYFFVAEGAPEAVVTDDVPDESLIQSQALAEFINAPPRAPFRALCEHRGQLIGVYADEPGVLHHSYFDPEYMVPEGWPSQWTTPVRPGDSDSINGLASFHEWLVIGKGHSLHQMTGFWPEFDVSPLEVSGSGNQAGMGIGHQGCFVQAGNMTLALTREGLIAIERSVSSGSSNLLATRLSGSINDLWRGIDYAHIVGGVFDRRRQTLMFFVRNV